MKCSQFQCKKRIIYPCLKFEERYITKLSYLKFIKISSSTVKTPSKLLMDPQLIRNLLSSCRQQRNIFLKYFASMGK